jgi:hypothetical protein
MAIRTEGTTTTETTYVCTKCKAEDHDRSGNAHPPVVLNCWNCGAGKGREVQEMLANRIGMFPVKRD